LSNQYTRGGFGERRKVRGRGVEDREAGRGMPEEGGRHGNLYIKTQFSPV